MCGVGSYICGHVQMHSAVEIVMFISQQYRPALHSFIFSVFKDVYTLLEDNGYM
jgi:hypothetical protein